MTEQLSHPHNFIFNKTDLNKLHSFLVMVHVKPLQGLDFMFASNKKSA